MAENRICPKKMAIYFFLYSHTNANNAISSNKCTQYLQSAIVIVWYTGNSCIIHIDHSQCVTMNKGTKMKIEADETHCQNLQIGAKIVEDKQ